MRIIRTILAVTLITLCSCARDRVKVSGRLGQSDGGRIMLEKVLPGETSVIDTVSIGNKGRFRFKAKTGKTPAIYNLRDGNGLITLLLAPGERVKIDIPEGLSGGYSVSGSEGSERMRELREIMLTGRGRLDSLSRAFDNADAKSKAAISAAYARHYQLIKQRQIGFIMSDPGSVSSAFALYQRLPYDKGMFIDKNTDLTYYKLVADSIEAKYPSSPYVKALRGTVSSLESKQKMSALINESLSGDAIKYPDIEMPDIHGKLHRLSDLDGKVVILDFWTAEAPGSAINNADMKKLYSQYADRGLAIYQVCADGTKHSWVSAVTAQQLPWASVCDLRGAMSPALQRYNIQAVPANYIIDRKGNIVGKNLFGDDLAKKIKELI